MTTQISAITREKLNALHNDASKDYLRIGKGMVKSIFGPMQPQDFEHAYLPVSKSQGEYLRQLIINHDCKTVVEFGTSFGISTIYLADAARLTGGRVITTELLESKALKAHDNISEAELASYVEVRIGDALETLEGFAEEIDFLFLDGWKDLYLPLFQMLEPKFKKSALVYADNMNMPGTRDYGQYVQSKYPNSTKIVQGGKAFLTKVV